MALANAYWSRPFGQWLLGFPELMRWLTYSTLALELLGPLLLFLPVLTVPARCLLIPAFLVFQHSIRLTIELGVFPWICTVALLPFVPGAVWERAGGWARGLVAEARDAGPLHPRGRLARAGWAAFLALWGLVLVSNLGVVHRSLSLPGPLNELIAFPRLMQAWGMYGPAPPKNSYGYAWQGVRGDGRALDLFEAGEGPEWERAARLHRDYRFKMYVDSLVRRGEPFQSRYVGWLCPRWNAGAAEGGRIASVRLHMRHRPLLPGGRPEALIDRVVFDLPCDAWAPFE